MSDRPDDVRYTSSHEWVRIEGDKATVGITDFAVEHLGDLVFVDLPSVGADVTSGEAACEVESVKAVGEVYSPVTGEVLAVNTALGDDPSVLAGDPFGAGWLFQASVSSIDESRLMDLAAYEQQLTA